MSIHFWFEFRQVNPNENYNDPLPGINAQRLVAHDIRKNEGKKQSSSEEDTPVLCSLCHHTIVPSPYQDFTP